ncbi:hypothetical protein HU200_024869 [Digitaria exilis]|uniref:MADS-box domain-containing protein n=1 Tax=Digitaria exilis TaxID=1010633 RepID=A0A835ETX7_9POAL|nr:hypothetical protein HU200_024869 [Digitaria exilis]
MVGPRGTGRRSQGRRRREIAFIKDPALRMVTFSKRKATLLKNASELSLLSGDHVAAIVFSEAGRPFAVGAPSVDHVLSRGAIDGDDGAAKATARRKDVTSARVAEEEDADERRRGEGAPGRRGTFVVGGGRGGARAGGAAGVRQGAPPAQGRPATPRRQAAAGAGPCKATEQ